MKKVFLTLFLIFTMIALMSQPLSSVWVNCNDLYGCDNEVECDAFMWFDCSHPSGGRIECVSGYTILCHGD